MFDSFLKDPAGVMFLLWIGVIILILIFMMLDSVVDVFRSKRDIRVADYRARKLEAGRREEPHEDKRRDADSH